MSLRDKLRVIDPCGFIDLDSVRRQGPITTTGTPGSCEVRHPDGALSYIRVSIEGSPELYARRDDPKKLSLAGTPAIETHDNPGNACRISIGRDTESSLTYLTGDSDCSMLESVVAASVPLIATAPAYPEPRGTLDRLDPCLPIETLPADRHPILHLQFDSLNTCAYSVAPDTYSTQVTVSFGTHRGYVELMQYVIGDARVSMTATGPNDCRASAQLDQRPDPAAQPYAVYDDITVSVNTGGCDATRPILAELIDRYRHMS
ncbi:hypothetical protein [Nocardia sp. NPDC056100]|uniref:hypothetical protein n=1 Tax=Nocardia sp. NPDC056100 TaxID=3345712 RepID=UPI0035DED2A9